MPRLKKSTRKRFKQVVAVLLCAMMLLPVITYFVPDHSTAGSQLEIPSGNAQVMENVPDDWKGPYEVVGVTNGDRIHIAIDNDTFRYVDLLGIEAPPVQDPETNEETKLGLDAYTYTRSLIEGHQVYLASEEEGAEQDVTKALVYLDDGLFLNEQILWDGFAKVSSPLPDDVEETFLNAQNEARKNKLGLWAEVSGEEK